MDNKQIKHDSEQAQYTRDREVMLSYSRAESAEVRWALANNVFVDSEILSLLANDADDFVRNTANKRLGYLGQGESSAAAKSPLRPETVTQLPFTESDGLSSLWGWGLAFLIGGVLIFFIGLATLLNAGYGSDPIGSIIAVAIGIACVNNGALFLILFALGQGIAYRIGKYLMVAMSSRTTEQ